MWPSLQGVLDNVFSAFVIYLLVLVGTYIMTRWIRRALDYIPLPILIVVGVGIYGLFMFGLNQTKEYFRSDPESVAVTPSPVVTSPPINPEPVVSLLMLSEELKEIIRKWLDDFHFQIRSNEREDAYFSFAVQGTSRNRFEILRTKKEREQFITVLGLLVYSKDDQEKVKSLPEPERRCIFAEIAMELRRQKIGNVLNLPESVLIQARIPIPELTQARLLDRIDDVDYAMNLTELKFSTLLMYGECREKTKSKELKKSPRVRNRK